MGHDYNKGFGNFTVTKSNPEGTTVRFTVSDANDVLWQPKMVKAVLGDAIDQWIAAERADLDTNGDSVVVGGDTRYPGDGYGEFTFNFGDKYAEVELTSLSNISSTGTITVAVPYADAV